ncbi:MAG: hypothetical protein ABH851_08890 [Methanobacteriota archaeon]
MQKQWVPPEVDQKIVEMLGSSKTLLGFVEQDKKSTVQIIKWREGGNTVTDIAHPWFVMEMIVERGTDVLPQEMTSDVKDLIERKDAGLNDCCAKVASEVGVLWDTSKSFSENVHGAGRDDDADTVLSYGGGAYRGSEQEKEILQEKLALEKEMIEHLKGE